MLRVWYVAIFIRGKQFKAIVAANSRAHAGRLLGVGAHQMAGWSSITRNEESNRVANAKPYTVFINRHGMNWPIEWIERTQYESTIDANAKT